MGLTQARQETDGKILNHDRCQGTQFALCNNIGNDWVCLRIIFEV